MRREEALAPVGELQHERERVGERQVPGRGQRLQQRAALLRVVEQQIDRLVRPRDGGRGGLAPASRRAPRTPSAGSRRCGTCGNSTVISIVKSAIAIAITPSARRTGAAQRQHSARAPPRTGRVFSFDRHVIAPATTEAAVPRQSSAHAVQSEAGGAQERGVVVEHHAQVEIRRQQPDGRERPVPRGCSPAPAVPARRAGTPRMRPRGSARPAASPGRRGRAAAARPGSRAAPCGRPARACPSPC